MSRKRIENVLLLTDFSTSVLDWLEPSLETNGYD
jgi:hypothetical protein